MFYALAVSAAIGSFVLVHAIGGGLFHLALRIAWYVVLGAWLVAVALFFTDYRDADGSFDCWPDCTVYQSVTQGLLLLGPFAFVGIAAVSAAILVIRLARRDRR